MRRAILLLSLALGSLAAAAADRPPATGPTTQPAFLPAADAPTLAARLGPLDVVTVRYDAERAGALESWDVVITDRDLLARLGAARRSGDRDMAMWQGSYGATARAGAARFTGRVGVLKIAAQPYGISLRAADGRWSLFVETGKAARQLDRLIEAEALRQRPAEPFVEQFD